LFDVLLVLPFCTTKLYTINYVLLNYIIYLAGHLLFPDGQPQAQGFIPQAQAQAHAQAHAQAQAQGFIPQAQSQTEGFVPQPEPFCPDGVVLLDELVCDPVSNFCI